MEVRADRILGRPVVALNGRRMGRLEEFRARRSGREWIVTEYVVGAAGLLERLGVGTRLILGKKLHGYVVRWDQLMLDDEGPARLTCRVSELQRR